MKAFNFISFIFLALLVTNCGDPLVDISQEPYHPKIVVEGFLYPGSTISNIKISRNFKLNTKVNPDSLVLTPTVNKTQVTINNIPLLFDEKSRTYYTNEITVETNKEYKLFVEAEIDGRIYSAEAVTVSPKKGFNVLENDLGAKKFGADKIQIQFVTSPGVSTYAFSIIADSASTDNFIYENKFFPNITPEKVEEKLNSFLFRFRFILNINSFADITYLFELEQFDLWFYSPYRIVAYACNQDYKDYLLTAKNVKEFDGNFHEPKSNFTGDGIGVFASAIRDTVYFTLVK